MNKEEAIKVLIQAAHLAQAKGAFSLENANVVAIAVGVLTPKEEIPQEDKPKKSKN